MIVFNRTQPGDFRVLKGRAVNRSRWDPAVWLVNPDLSAFRGVPYAHLQVAAGSDAIELRPQAERDAADAEQRDAVTDRIVDEFDQDTRALRALALVLLNELNQRAADHNALIDAITGAGSLAQVRNRVGAVRRQQENRTAAQLRAAVLTQIRARST